MCREEEVIRPAGAKARATANTTITNTTERNILRQICGYPNVGVSRILLSQSLEENFCPVRNVVLSVKLVRLSAQDNLKSMADIETQRQELYRLLDSAKDFKRRSIIQKAIDGLEDKSGGVDGLGGFGNIMTTMNHSVIGLTGVAASEIGRDASLHVMQAGNNVELSPNRQVGSSGRPMSSRQRRPSIGVSLDAIPENRILKQRNFERNVEVELEAQDVSDVTASSQDPRFPPTCFLLSTGKDKHVWISTGMFPQVLTLHFKQHWTFRKIQIVADGADDVHLVVRAGTVQVDSVPMERLSNIFLLDVKMHQSDRDSLCGNQVKFILTSGSNDFVSVLGIQVVAVPYIPEGGGGRE